MIEPDASDTLSGGQQSADLPLRNAQSPSAQLASAQSPSAQSPSTQTVLAQPHDVQAPAIHGSSSLVAWAQRARFVANGLWGDSLDAAAVSFAVHMGIYTQSGRLATPAALAELSPPPSSRICLLVHGLFCSESSWTFCADGPGAPQTDYGRLLQADFACTPLYLRYNTGLSIAANGRELDDLLEALISIYPVPVNEILLIGHSMGGLVLRRACIEGALRGSAWVERVSRIVYLGVPHEGADLAKLTRYAADTLLAIPNPVTRLIGRILNQRSQGLRDLCDGLDGSAQGEMMDLEEISWLPSAHHLHVSGSLAKDSSNLASLLFGDGLVRTPRCTQTTLVEHALVAGVHHMALTGDPRVYEQIRSWCTEY